VAHRTFSEEMRAEARRLFDEGYGCNAIARKIEIAPSAVSDWAKDEGLRFDRSQAALAVRAHTVDMAEGRLDLARKMQQVANDLLDSLDGEYLVYSFGGKENDYNEHMLEAPPVEVIRSAVVTAGIAFDKATKVLEKSIDGVAGAHSLLDALATGFAAAAIEYEAGLPDDA
jgi:predicted transcriptional regulator